MSILGSSWLPKGYYEFDGFDYTFVDDPEKIRELQNEGRLYEHDGMGLTQVNNNDEIHIKGGKYKN